VLDPVLVTVSVSVRKLVSVLESVTVLGWRGRGHRGDFGLYPGAGSA